MDMQLRWTILKKNMFIYLVIMGIMTVTYSDLYLVKNYSAGFRLICMLINLTSTAAIAAWMLSSPNKFRVDNPNKRKRLEKLVLIWGFILISMLILGLQSQYWNNLMDMLKSVINILTVSIGFYLAK